MDFRTLQKYNNNLDRHHFSETPDGKYRICIYNITEYSMLAYTGLFAIFSKQDNLSPLINSAQIHVWFDKDNTFYYCPMSDCLIFRQSIYIKSGQQRFPFLLIKPTEKLIALIDWDFTSIYYGLTEVEKDTLKLKVIYPKELDCLKSPREKAPRLISLNTLDWYDINKFDDLVDIYHLSK